MSIEDDPVLSEAARPVDADPEAEEESESKPSALRNVVEWVVIAAGALIVAFLIKTFLLQAFYIPSLSMAPTLQVNDRVLVNKLSYDLHEVNRGDLVVFESLPNESADTKDLIKRVIGLPGETVSSRDGQILINGQVLEEPYLDEGVTTGPLEPTTIPPDHVWVMGDNRANSRDSRFFGPVPQSLIIGRAFVRVWPITDIGLL